MSIELLERVDNFAGVRNALKRIAEDRQDWAGIPMPIEDAPLVIEPNYPNAKGLMSIGRNPADDEADDTKVRNRFWSTKHRCDIYVVEREGRITHAVMAGGSHHFDQDLRTMAASVAWGIKQESNALQTLSELLPHHAFKKYLLTGMFLESSQRSGISYVFRRLKPTVALRARDDRMYILTTLCLHPIAYYEGSWAGAMCPTDDVIAHLMLMRGNEPMYWRRANQHAAHRPEAGL